MSGSGSIIFPNFPAATNRNPGVFIDVQPGGANTQQNYRALIVGQITSAGAATPGVPLICSGAADAVKQGGPGSMLALMATRYVQEDSFGEVWYLPLADATGATAATLAIVFSGTSTAAGTFPLYVAGVSVPISVPTGMLATALAAAAIAAVNANSNLPVTASATTSVSGGVTFTAKNAGLCGNDIDVRVAYYGTLNGEFVPAGITFTGMSVGTGTQLSGGATNPTTTLATALANLSTKKYNFVAWPYTDSASLTTWQTFMNNTSGRWSWQQMLYGGAFAAYRGTYAALGTFGTTRNDPAMSIMGFYDAPEPAWVWAADICANCAISLRANPAVPLQYITLGTLPPPVAAQFSFGEDNTLLYDGISTFTVNQGGECVISRMITTYQTNAAGVPDASYLDVETRYTLDFVCTYMRNQLQAQYSRNILVSNATKISSPGTPIVTPAMIETTVINIYNYLETQGLVQNSAAFAQAVNVQIVSPGVVGVFWPGDLANQLRDIGVLVQFSKT